MNPTELNSVNKDFQGGRDIISYLRIGVKMGSNWGQNRVKMGQNRVKEGSQWSKNEYDIISYPYIFHVLGSVWHFELMNRHEI